MPTSVVCERIRMRFLQWLFKSRYVTSLEADLALARAELVILRDFHTQVTSNLLQGAGMTGIDLNHDPAPTPNKRMIPSQWRAKMEQMDRAKVPVTKESN